MSMHQAVEQARRERLALVRHYCGAALAGAATVHALPILTALIYGELRPGLAMAASALAMVALGWWLWRGGAARAGRAVQAADAALIVMVSWSLVILASSAALVFGAGLSMTHALFEATSGWTTTGLSVVDVERAPRSVLMLRSCMELFGGMGLVLAMITILGRFHAATLSAAEGRADRLLPDAWRSARAVALLYGGYALSGTVALWVAGMGLFDAINHSFAAISTGGFSTRADSIGAWQSPAIEAVTIVLMVLGTTSFLVGYQLIIRKRWREVARSAELRLMVGLLAVVVPALAMLTTAPLYGMAPSAWRIALFEAVSALSTTGFSTVSYAQWGGFGWWCLIALMIIGGGAGSTAGGLKQWRVVVLWRLLVSVLRQGALPSGAIIPVRATVQGQRRVLEEREVRHTVAFAALYLGTLAIGTGFMAAYGVPLQAALFEMASTLSTVGLSVGVTSASTPAPVLWMQTCAMVLGRLEFFIIFAACARLGTLMLARIKRSR